MPIATLLLLFSTSLLNVKPTPVYADLSIGNEGPYRFLVDTGSQTSLIDAKLAARLNLKPAFRVAVVTQNSSRLMPALKLKNLALGQTRLPETELVFHDLAGPRRLDPSIQGVLGLNALAGADFALSPRTGRLDVAAKRPAGEVVPLFLVEDRLALKARMGGETLTLILDSGATHVVLFRVPDAMAKTPPVSTTFGTIEGAHNVVPTCWTADMFFGDGLRIGTQAAAIVNRPGTGADGLLPASIFKTIYIDHGRGEAVLVR